MNPHSREAMTELAALRQEAEEKGITENVISFLNYAAKLARQAELARRRKEAQLWRVTRQEVKRWAENGVPEPGAILKYGPGVIRVFTKTDEGYVLDSVHFYKGGVWRRKRQPGRVVVQRVKGKNLVVVK